MKKFIVNEKGIDLLKKEVLSESYSDKVSLVKDFLDSNFLRANLEKKGEDGTIKNIGIFIQLNQNKIPTDYSLTIEDVLDILQNEFQTILTDKSQRDKFLIQAIKDWYDNKITKSGNLSTYNF